MEAAAPHILVVDDDRRLRALLHKYLAENGFVVTTAADAADARARLAGLAFDLIVLDVMMPGESGLDFMEALRRSSDTPVLLLTAMGEADDRIAGLERGADDYLPKPFEPRELLLRIASILRRSRAEPVPRRLVIGDLVFDLERGELTRDAEAIALTTGERALLGLFARNAGVTLSRDDLCREAMPGASPRTVDVQVTRLRRKLEPDPKVPRYLQTVWGVGYVLNAG